MKKLYENHISYLVLHNKLLLEVQLRQLKEHSQHIVVFLGSSLRQSTGTELHSNEALKTLDHVIRVKFLYGVGL